MIMVHQVGRKTLLSCRHKAFYRGKSGPEQKAVAGRTAGEMTAQNSIMAPTIKSRQVHSKTCEPTAPFPTSAL
ncbi:hypothetical protein EVAR_28860_1 [Eumeta japonica]|uniref:Uncharacterized protein n=1 Tax=Eumeta variegata TaxID=151549 RepID=A0A4C1YHT3_EUMVA|nr:hypothetical protein EVAR_28860_1 [Eumeta japonica]